MAFEPLRLDDLPPASNRLRRRRRSPLITALVLLTPAPVAAWIVFHFDLPNKIRSLMAISSGDHAVTADRTAPPPPIPRRPAPVRRRRAADEDRRERTPADAPASRAQPSSRTQDDARVAALASPPSPAETAIDAAIGLDLAVARRQFHRLNAVDGLRFRIIRLDGCDAPYEVEPQDACFGVAQPATIVLAGAA